MTIQGRALLDRRTAALPELREMPVGFHNRAAVADQWFQAAGEHSVRHRQLAHGRPDAARWCPLCRRPAEQSGRLVSVCDWPVARGCGRRCRARCPPRRAISDPPAWGRSGRHPRRSPGSGPHSPQPASAPWHGDDAVAALSRSVASGTGGDQPVGVPPGHAGAWWPAAEPAPRRDHRRLEGLTGSAHRHQRAAAYPPAARRRQRRFPRRCRALRRERTQCGHDTPAWRLRTVDKRWQPDDLVHPHRHLRAEHGGGHVRQHLHNARPVPASRTRRILSSCIN